jgi:hypothetical protein
VCETDLSLLNIIFWTLEMFTDTCVVLHVKCVSPFSLSTVTCGKRDRQTDRQTDRRDEASRRDFVTSHFNYAKNVMDHY